MTEDTGMTSPIIHIGNGKVAAVSFIMICWRTSVIPVQPVISEEQHRGADVDRHREMAKKAAAPWP